jgi:lysophospholipase
VVITGSQIPLVEGRNDGIDNLLGAITLAGHFDLPEVCLFFHNQLFRGSRVIKKNCSDLDAFGSPNMDALCKVGKYNALRKWLISPFPPSTYLSPAHGRSLQGG